MTSSNTICIYTTQAVQSRIAGLPPDVQALIENLPADLKQMVEQLPDHLWEVVEQLPPYVDRRQGASIVSQNVVENFAPFAGGLAAAMAPGKREGDYASGGFAGRCI